MACDRDCCNCKCCPETDAPDVGNETEPEVAPEPAPQPQPEPDPDNHTIIVSYDTTVTPAHRQTIQVATSIAEKLLDGPEQTVRVSVTARPLQGFTDDGPGGTLAAAGPTRYGPDGVPTHGQMFLDPSDQMTVEIVLHELLHVLGMVYNEGTVYANLVDVDNAVFTGGRATEAWRSFGLTGFPPVEPAPDLSHWRETVFGHELATPSLGEHGRAFVSTITLGMLADIGYSVTDFTGFDVDDQILASALSLSDGCFWCNRA